MDHHLPIPMGGPPPFVHLLGGVMFGFTLLVLLGLFLLTRRGHFGPPPWLAQRHSPEADARRILAERFARGDIASDEFMERASVLNWTPGAEQTDVWRSRKKRR